MKGKQTFKREQGDKYKERQRPTHGEENEQNIYGNDWPSPSHASPRELVYGIQGTCPSGAQESTCLKSASKAVCTSCTMALLRAECFSSVCTRSKQGGSICRVCIAPGISCRVPMHTSSSSRWRLLGLRIEEGYARDLLSLNCWHQTLNRTSNINLNLTFHVFRFIGHGREGEYAHVF